MKLKEGDGVGAEPERRAQMKRRLPASERRT